MSGSTQVGGLIVGYVIAGGLSSLYYMSQADTNDSGTVTQAEYDAAVEAGNPIITGLLGPGMMIGEEILVAAGMIEEAEPSA